MRSPRVRVIVVVALVAPICACSTNSGSSGGQTDASQDGIDDGNADGRAADGGSPDANAGPDAEHDSAITCNDPDYCYTGSHNFDNECCPKDYPCATQEGFCGHRDASNIISCCP